MKYCHACQEEKEITDFFKDKNRPDGASTQCKLCHKERINKRHRKHREYLNQYKLDKGCASCGYNELPYVLHFDHIDPSSKDKVLKGRYGIEAKWGMDRINKELTKCQILCANCHAIKTHKERNK